jgi:hypothetical protein
MNYKCGVQWRAHTPGPRPPAERPREGKFKPMKRFLTVLTRAYRPSGGSLSEHVGYVGLGDQGPGGAEARQQG